MKHWQKQATGRNKEDRLQTEKIQGRGEKKGGVKVLVTHKEKRFPKKHKKWTLERQMQTRKIKALETQNINRIKTATKPPRTVRETHVDNSHTWTIIILLRQTQSPEL